MMGILGIFSDKIEDSKLTRVLLIVEIISQPTMKLCMLAYTNYKVTTIFKESRKQQTQYSARGLSLQKNDTICTSRKNPK